MDAPEHTGNDFLAEALHKDPQTDNTLRPLSFDDFGGQPKTVERLMVMSGAAKKREEALSHVLLSGPPGLGKTTLALIIGIPKTVEEYLYSAMEDFRIDIMLDQGPNARSIRLDIPRFTLVGATTRMGLLTAPLRSRFTLQTRLNYYNRNDLTHIVKRSCALLGVPINEDGACEIAGRARGTPRIANNLVSFVRDYAEQRADGKITQQVASAALELLEIDQYGLDEMDKRILGILAENYKGGPAGIGTIAVAVSEEVHTLEEVHEPYLIQEGYLQRTAQGRMLTPKAWKILDKMPPAGSQMNLID